MAQCVKKIKVLFFAKSSSSHNSDIFVKAKRVSLFWEMSLFGVSLLWVGTVLYIHVTSLILIEFGTGEFIQKTDYINFLLRLWHEDKNFHIIQEILKMPFFIFRMIFRKIIVQEFFFRDVKIFFLIAFFRSWLFYKINVRNNF